MAVICTMRLKKVKGTSKGSLYSLNPDHIVVPENSSPLAKVFTYVFRAVFNIVPEKRDEIIKIFGSKHVRIQLVDDINVIMGANTDKKIIQFSVRTLEFFWAISCRIGILFNGTLENKKLGEEAKKLSIWVKRNFRKLGILPTGLIPTLSIVENQLVNEIFLAAIAWMLHHELVHIEKDHPTPSKFELDNEYRKIEKDADRLAAERIVESTNTMSKMREKRLLGILVALIGIAYLDRNVTHGYAKGSRALGFRERVLNIKYFHELPDEQFFALNELLDADDPFFEQD